MNRIGFGLIGLGLAVKPHALAIKDLAHKIDFIGGFSPSIERRTGFHQQYGLPVFETLAELVNDARVGAVLILTPPRTHAELAERAAKAGKHILLEKPLDVTLAAARQTVSMVDAANKVLGVVFQFRFRRGIAALREILRQGDLGEIVSASATIRWWRGADYFAQSGRGMLARDGGGVLITQAIHTLDALLHLVGPAASVSAVCRSSGLRTIDTEDIACATVQFQCGAIGVIDATTTAYPGYPERIEIAGNRGSAVVEAEKLIVYRAGKPVIEISGSSQGGGGADPMAFSHEWHRALIEDFVDSIATGRQPLASGRSALAVHALIDAMLQSSIAQRRVAVVQG